MDITVTEPTSRLTVISVWSSEVSAMALPRVVPRAVFVQPDLPALTRQQHAVIQFVGDRAGQVLKSDEVDHIVVLIQISLNFDGSTVVVTVEPLAVVAVICDEVTRTEDQVILRDPDLEKRRRHG